MWKIYVLNTSILLLIILKSKLERIGIPILKEPRLQHQILKFEQDYRVPTFSILEMYIFVVVVYVNFKND